MSLWHAECIPGSCLGIDNEQVTECTVCVPGHDLFNLSFCHSFSFLIGQKFYGSNKWSVKTLSQCSYRSRLFLSCCLGTHVFDSGGSLHCFLVGVNKSYVIATSDLWLFIYTSNLPPSLPTLLPYKHNYSTLYYSTEVEAKSLSMSHVMETLPGVSSNFFA